MELVRNRIQDILKSLNKDLFERENVLSLSLLGALSGQNVFLYGPPGTAKSLIARRINSVFENCNYFECLLQKFSTPEDVFGPVSIRELQEDRYQRKVAGFLPDADIAFLDEIWKSSPPILNTLLEILNERKFRNGNMLLDVPLLFTVAASNEIPSEEQGLSALYDRFSIRIPVLPIRDTEAFRKMVSSAPMTDGEPKEGITKIRRDEVLHWREEIKNVIVSDDCLAAIKILRRKLSEPPYGLYVSDRKWVNAVAIIKAGAFFSGRMVTEIGDCLVLTDCLWDKPEDRDTVAKVIADSIIEDCTVLSKRLDELEAKVNGMMYERDYYHSHFMKEIGEECFSYTLEYDGHPSTDRSEWFHSSIKLLIPVSRIHDTSWWHPLDKDCYPILQLLASYDETERGFVFRCHHDPNELPHDYDKYKRWNWEKCQDNYFHVFVYKPIILHKKGSLKPIDTTVFTEIGDLAGEIENIQTVFYSMRDLIKDGKNLFVSKDTLSIAYDKFSEGINTLERCLMNCKRLHQILSNG